MKRRIAILGLMIVSSVVVLPASGLAGPGNERSSATVSEYHPQIRYRTRTWRTNSYRYRNRRWDNDRDRRRSGRWYGYRNYGQYRRTQVGNRRYRTVTRYYWDNGRRRTRLVRLYY